MQWSMASLDFVRAMSERPWLVRIMCRLFMGRYAYREFLFMIDGMQNTGYVPHGWYGLREHPYHNDRQRWRWWLRP